MSFDRIGSCLLSCWRWGKSLCCSLLCSVSGSEGPAKDSYFPGFGYEMAGCGRCGAHVGWVFNSIDSTPAAGVKEAAETPTPTPTPDAAPIPYSETSEGVVLSNLNGVSYSSFVMWVC